jgi:hypothetical protein
MIDQVCLAAPILLRGNRRRQGVGA